MISAISYTDGYKLDHRRQAPKKNNLVYSNLTARGSRLEGIDYVISFGLQYFEKEYLIRRFNETFFYLDREQAVANYREEIDLYLPGNTIGTKHIEDLHRLGYLPIEIKSLPEGTLVPCRVPLLTIENTHDDFAWLTNYLETIMSCVLWMPITSATKAFDMRLLMEYWAIKTGGDLGFVDWQGHDFSFRGMPGFEAACMSDGGHLLSFTGTDTFPAPKWVKDYYNERPVAGSVSATEHMIASSWIAMPEFQATGDGELEYYKNLITEVYKEGVVSAVSDTVNLWKVCTEILPKLHNDIMSRNGKLVIRPDSGVPEDILCGDPNGETEAERLGVIRLLWNEFGGIINKNGYKVLDSHIGAIYGDSIHKTRAEEIFKRLEKMGFASTNVVLGLGSFFYQYNTRDTFNIAVKGTLVEVDGVEINISKSPVTDKDKTKHSATGFLSVVIGKDGKLELIQKASKEDMDRSQLTTSFKNSILTRNDNWFAIRGRVQEAKKKKLEAM